MKTHWIILTLRFLPACSCLFIMTSGCVPNNNETDRPEPTKLTVAVPDADNQIGPSATPTHDFAWEDSRADCQFSSDCILMEVGNCDTIQAIHFSQIATAEAYSAQSKEKSPEVVCAPNWPIEEVMPLCLNQHCRAVLKNYHLLLEVPGQPVAGQPFWVGMSFRYHEALEQVEARFLLPEGMQVVDGQASWSGPVEAGREYVIWVEVQTNKVGDIYLAGWTGIKQGDPSIPALSRSDYVEVSSPISLTPWPERERILPTPTPAP